MPVCRTPWQTARSGDWIHGIAQKTESSRQLEAMMQSIRRTLATAGVCAVALAGVLAPLPAAAAPPAGPLPAVSPTPQSMSRAGADITVPERVEVVVDESTDAAALA